MLFLFLGILKRISKYGEQNVVGNLFGCVGVDGYDCIC